MSNLLKNIHNFCQNNLVFSNIGVHTHRLCSKNIATFLAIALSFGVFAQQNDSMIFHQTQPGDTPPVVVPTCNTNTPGWGNSFGTVSFATTQTWSIQGTGANSHITQIWSDAVTATACNKSDFSGGSAGNFNADCRSNPNYPGDLFSWCAVVRFQHTLCPTPWRVPTQQDFIDLDRALGGNGSNRTDVTVRNKLIATSGIVGQFWGGTYGGYCSSGGSLSVQDSWAVYGSLAERVVTTGRNLYFATSGNVSPQNSLTKNYGLMLRCVR
jgi:uncharacterized protein (TIGR02145 family)